MLSKGIPLKRELYPSPVEDGTEKVRVTMATAGRARSGGSRSKVVKVSKKEVQQLLNGQPTGVVIPEAGQTIGAVAMEMARSNGLKTIPSLWMGRRLQPKVQASPWLATAP